MKKTFPHPRLPTPALAPALAAAALATAALATAGCFRNPISKIELHVPAMTNQACADAVMNALRPLIENTPDHPPHVDWQHTHTITAYFNNVELGRRNLEVAITHAGFAVNDLPPNPRLD